MNGYHIQTTPNGKRVTIAADSTTLSTLFEQFMGLLEHHMVAVTVAFEEQELFAGQLTDALAKTHLSSAIEAIEEAGFQFHVAGESCGVNHHIALDQQRRVIVETKNLAFVKKTLKKHDLEPVDQSEQLSYHQPSATSVTNATIEALIGELKTALK